MVTSLPTVADALGAGLEDEDTIREAAFVYRQRRRNDANKTEGDSATQ